MGIKGVGVCTKNNERRDKYEKANCQANTERHLSTRNDSKLYVSKRLHIGDAGSGQL